MLTNEISTDIEYLIKLQEVYREVFKLQKEKKSLKLNPNQANEQLSDIEEDIENLKNEIDTLENEIKRNNIDIDTNKDKISSIREKQKIIQSPKEFAYLDNQEKLFKNEITELENDNKERLKELEDLKLDLELKNEEYKTKSQEITDNLSSANEREAQIEQKLQEKLKLKNELSQKISISVLRDFERIANGRDGTGIVPVDNSFCTGCNISLPPRVISRIRKKQEIIFCQNCARILYWKE